MAENLLLVEDSLTQALRLKLVLQGKGLQVTMAASGREAVALAVLLLPAAIVLDVNLPDMDGFQVCRALKDHPATMGTPVILLAVQDGAIDTLAGLEAGADAYIPKEDFSMPNLLRTLHDLGVL